MEEKRKKLKKMAKEKKVYMGHHGLEQKRGKYRVGNKISSFIWLLKVKTIALEKCTLLPVMSARGTI